ncbi:serine hydrolase domain-containing protein [Paenibacillus eucommiae]|uniref:CubicO group peptidase (Beta-lactamase class C family) n=1 Tax=Paenibacillus eucommiae TaxID=1355755 RepID=A0ABS4J011_9BACL|nr:serine hydrolase domain-containing protein [Paenibacillus eucommiae]MBP1993148.1 CubicO group peptidase (beta-lactamase class C family) [Paenibacillus eucommiae]
MDEQTDFREAANWGISPAQLDGVWEPIREAIRQKLIPGATAAILWKGGQISYASGLAVDTKEKAVPARFNTIYDCASLTKVVATLPVLLLLIDQGKLKLEDPVVHYVPEFDHGGKREITIRHLLTHTSGLAASEDFHTQAWDLERILRSIGNKPLSYEPGKQVIYSDLGFILLGVIAARLLNMNLDQAAKQWIFSPLGMLETGYCPPSELLPRIAATELSQETGTYWHGVVHDENARAAGGISGHAGLFSTAGDLLKYARMWLNSEDSIHHSVLSPSVIAASTGLQTSGISGSRRGLGWVLKGDQADVSGSFSSEAYGHTGFTGTSLYFDPQLDLAAVLLTNRVHYGRGQNITQLRSDFHDAAAALIRP